MPSPRQVQVVPAALGLEALQLEVQAVEIEEGDVPLRQVRLVGRGIRIAADHAAGLHRLDLRIPVEHDLVLLQVVCASIASPGSAA